MSPEAIELAASAVVTLVLVGLGVFYFFREHREWRRQGAYRNLPEADQRHFRRQYVRRVIGSVLLIAAGVAVFIGQGVMDWRATPRLYAWLWIGVMLGLLGLIALASADLVAIHRYSRRHRQRIEQDRNAMIERQLAEYRAARTAPPPLPPDWSPEHN